MRQHLSGRVVVQLSTSTPQEARDSEDLLNAAGALYLDGAIDCGPGDIDTPSTLVLVSGNEAAFEQARRFLESLGGETRYLGPNVRAASVLALASVCEAYGRFMAVTHAACICDSEGVDLDALAKMFPEDSFSQRYIDVINSSDYQNPGGTLRVWGAAIQRIRKQASDAGIHTGFPDYVVEWFEKAIDEGYGDEHVMALFKVMRSMNND